MASKHESPVWMEVARWFSDECAPPQPIVIYPGDLDSFGWREFFHHKKWSDLAEQYFREGSKGPISEVVSYLNWEGFRYYLPMLLMIVEEKKDGEMLSAVRTRLNREAENVKRDFSQGQREFVKRFCRERTARLFKKTR